MRDNDATGRIVEGPPSAFWIGLSRGLRLTAIALGVGLVMAAGPVKAGDDDDEDDKTFEEKIIEGIMKGIGGTNMENQGINYRERSPLVVPPKLNLPPPPGTTAEVNAPNWPKDPDEKRRKEIAKARKNANKDPREAGRVLMPSELAQKGTKSSGGDSVDQPGNPPGGNPILSPSQLGYSGGLERPVRRQQDRDGAVQGRADPGLPDPAAARLPDAVAEFRLRHRAEGVAEQGIQSVPGQVWRIVKLVSRLRDRIPALAPCTLARFP